MTDDDNGYDGSPQQLQIYSRLGQQDRGAKLVDFTEQKLLRLEKLLKDDQQKAALTSLLKKYREGHVAVGWHKGSPMWTTLTRD